ncbi:MerR family transcriptional regulator [Amycolatopsis cihanbeyliensis]|uniref:DNA-binding transcriptional MerR regulator n=1 Tax=Amycolatopsis cihanbeyliensis TaxID=1128664 RepID=A0A542DF61_AMYCI|nr:MerR family transcriptional regulator [Amycolatopsis cihanbeyliensis]TQJ01704.1 DNA-binding transcriptional MerR regulator [Amycolatopsis cihanbeyliensis]
MDGLMQIGEVAERTGLSLRTIRYYEEVELVVPSARSQGGFRLYTEPDVNRLALAKRMKSLGFQLEEMLELLAILDPVPGGPRIEDPAPRLAEFAVIAQRRCAELHAQLRRAEEFADLFRAQLAHYRRERQS